VSSFLTAHQEQEISDFDAMAIPKGSSTWYTVECDLTYPETLHQLHNDYPTAAEHLTAVSNMFSDYARVSEW